MRFKPLNAQDKVHLRAAEGWFELGDCDSAIKELEQITPEAQSDGTFQSLRHCVVIKKAGRWKLGEGLAAETPDHPQYWINLAGSNQKVRQFAEAKRLLIEAHTRFPCEFIFQFMLACSCAQLQQLDESAEWLKKAMALDEKKIVQELAARDPDLKPLLDYISAIK